MYDIVCPRTTNFLVDWELCMTFGTLALVWAKVGHESWALCFILEVGLMGIAFSTFCVENGNTKT